MYKPLTEPVSLILVIFKVKPGKKTIYVFSHVKLHWHSQIFNKKYPPSFTSFKSRSLNLYDILIRLCRHCPKAIQWITIRESNSHCQLFKVIVNERLLLHHEISSGIIFFIQQFLCIQLNIYFKFQRFSNLSNIFYIFYPSIIFMKTLRNLHTLSIDTTYQILRNDPFDATRIQSERFKRLLLFVS